MKRYLFCCIAALIMLLPKYAKSQDSNTIQGLLQYIMQPLDKNQIGNGYLEEYGFPAISMATYNGVLSANNRFELNSWRLLFASVMKVPDRYFLPDNCSWILNKE